MMGPQVPEHAIVVMLRQCFSTPMCQSSRQWRASYPRNSRAFHTTRRPQPHHPAIEGQQWPYRARHGTKSSSRSSSSTAEPSGSRGRDMAASANPEARKNIAVLGGGVTGLTAAHYLTREFPNAHVTIYEGSGRLGGWVKSTKVDVGSGHAVLEQGPRTLRPHTVAGGVTQELVRLSTLVRYLLTDLLLDM